MSTFGPTVTLCLGGVHRRSTPPSKPPMFEGPISNCPLSLAILLSNPVGCFGASIPDGVASLQANPLGDGPVLLLGLGQLLLGAERLVGLSQRLARRVHGMLRIFVLLEVVRGTYRHLDGVRMSSVVVGRWSPGLTVAEPYWRDKFERPQVRELVSMGRSAKPPAKTDFEIR